MKRRGHLIIDEFELLRSVQGKSGLGRGTSASGIAIQEAAGEPW